MTDATIRRLIHWLGQLQALLFAMIKEPTWRSQDGRITPVRKMDSNHLANTIRYIERGCDGLRPPPPVLQIMIAEQQARLSRGDSIPPAVKGRRRFR